MLEQTAMASLSARSRAHLKALAHPLAPVVQVGQEGVTHAVAQAATVALEDHELIKVKLGQGFTGEREDAAATLSAQTGGQVVQVIGRVVVLYRPRSKSNPRRPRIRLPAA